MLEIVHFAGKKFFKLLEFGRKNFFRIKNFLGAISIRNMPQKIFKFKYRQNADNYELYEARNRRMIERFYERAKQRDPVLEQDLRALLGADQRDSSLAAFMLDPENSTQDSAERETRPFREYMVNEAIEQYKDYYESDPEEE